MTKNHFTRKDERHKSIRKKISSLRILGLKRSKFLYNQSFTFLCIRTAERMTREELTSFLLLYSDSVGFYAHFNKKIYLSTQMREKIKIFLIFQSLQSVALLPSCATSAAQLGLIAEQAEEGTSISAVADIGHCRRKGHFFCFIFFSSLVKENEDVSTEGEDLCLEKYFG